MGCAAALALADRGARVVLLERAVPGAEASSAAAGILGAQLEVHAYAPLLPMFVRARAEYTQWAVELRARTGIDVGHRVTGGLRVATRDDDAEAVTREVAWQRSEGLRAEILDAAAARAVEPELAAANVRCAAYFPDDAQVDPPALLRALVLATARPFAGGGSVVTRSGTTVAELVVEGDRCVGARLEDGSLLRCDATVLAAGSWSSLIPGVPAALPKVRPARGQMLMLEERPPRLTRMVFGKEAYVVPRGDGRVLCGSTLEFVGFRREVTAGGLHAILDGCLALVPGLHGAPLTSTWSSFRPYVDAPEPLMGASPLAGLFLATGHHRNGILLAKVTADAVADAVLGASSRAP